MNRITGALLLLLLVFVVRSARAETGDFNRPELPGSDCAADALPPQAVKEFPRPDYETIAHFCIAQENRILSLPFQYTYHNNFDNNCPEPPYNDTFFRFQAREPGSYAFMFRCMVTGAMMRIWYSDTCCQGTSRVASSDSNWYLSPRITEFLNAGQAVILECGFATPRGFADELTFIAEKITDGLHDHCETAIPCEVPSVHYGTNLWGERILVNVCGPIHTQTTPDVWYRLSGDGHEITASLCSDSTDFDAEMQLYFGDCDSLRCLYGNDSGGAGCGTRPRITWCGLPDTQYFLRIAGTLAVGHFRLSLQAGLGCPPTIYFCGTPTEVEPNNDGSPWQQARLIVNEYVYGHLGLADTSDFWFAPVSYPQCYRIRVYDGDSCQNYPPQCAGMKLYDYGRRAYIDSSARSEWVVYSGSVFDFIKVVAPADCEIGYRIESEQFMPLGSAVNIHSFGHIYVDKDSAEMCQWSASPHAIRENMCGGASRWTGQPLVYNVNGETVGTIHINATGLDPMIGIFSGDQCIASMDTSRGPQESLDYTFEQVWTSWKIVVGNPDYLCGPLTVDIVCDQFLPVSLLSFDAASGDRNVTLRWRSGSENNLHRYEIERDGQLVAFIPAQNSANGAAYSWTDRELTNGMTYRYTLYNRNLDGTRDSLGSVAAAPDLRSGMITEYALQQNYPNPFNPQTRMDFDLPESGPVRLEVFNVMGRIVATLVNQTLAEGRHTAVFNAGDLPSGIYFSRLTVTGQTLEKKMLLLK